MGRREGLKKGIVERRKMKRREKKQGVNVSEMKLGTKGRKWRNGMKVGGSGRER